jgi:hypothetical protein
METITIMSFEYCARKKQHYKGTKSTASLYAYLHLISEMVLSFAISSFNSVLLYSASSLAMVLTNSSLTATALASDCLIWRIMALF